jgi:membrane protease YdiL (CAAX protease family)
MAGYVGGRTLMTAEPGIAEASTYLFFAGMLGLAAFAFAASGRARRPVLVQLLAMALFACGVILVAYPFDRRATVPLVVLTAAMIALAVVTWRDLQTPAIGAADVPATTVAWRWSALWIPVAAVAAAYFALGDLNPLSSYWTRWLAVAAALVAVVGRTHRWAALVAAVAAAVGAVYVGSISALAVTPDDGSRFVYVVAAVAVIALSTVQLARLVKRVPPLDPVSLIAAQLGVVLLLRWAFYLGSGLGLDPSSYGVGTTATPFRAELPLLAMALAAVGLGISRPPLATLRRFGLEIPKWWHVLLALGLADVYLVLGYPVNLLTYKLMPNAYFQIGDVLYKTDFHLPYWAFMAYGLLAGICEESLFRGALQARVGILVTAVLFAAIHVQYGLTPILGLVFVAGLAYGLIRRHINLTTAVIAHAATDTGGFPLAPAWETNLLWMAVILVVVALDVGRRRINRPSRTAPDP